MSDDQLSDAVFAARINRALEMSEAHIRAGLDEFAKKVLTLAATDRISAWRKIDISLCGGRSEYAITVMKMIENGATGDEALDRGIAVAIEKDWLARLRHRLS